MRVVVVMPTWNEAEGVAGFLEELHEALAVWEVSFLVVDDASTDGTGSLIASMGAEGFPVRLIANPANQGHGSSTRIALREGLALRPDVVVAVDGDGQFNGKDIRHLVELKTDSQWDIIEGVRTARGDPLYRRLVTAVTRIFIALRTGTLPRDANTPLRVYAPTVLESLLKVIPNEFPTPNLLISAQSRRWGLSILEVQVQSLPRRGATAQGSTWGQGLNFLPTKRFVRFCRGATAAWMKTRLESSPPSTLLLSANGTVLESDKGGHRGSEPSDVPNP